MPEAHEGLWHARGEAREASTGCSSRLGLKVKGVGFHPCSGVTIGGRTLSLVNSIMTNQEYSDVSSEPWWVVTPQRGGASWMGLNVLTWRCLQNFRVERQAE